MPLKLTSGIQALYDLSFPAFRMSLPAFSLCLLFFTHIGTLAASWTAKHGALVSQVPSDLQPPKILPELLLSVLSPNHLSGTCLWPSSLKSPASYPAPTSFLHYFYPLSPCEITLNCGLHCVPQIHVEVLTSLFPGGDCYLKIRLLNRWLRGRW